MKNIFHHLLKTMSFYNFTFSVLPNLVPDCLCEWQNFLLETVKKGISLKVKFDKLECERWSQQFTCCKYFKFIFSKNNFIRVVLLKLYVAAWWCSVRCSLICCKNVCTKMYAKKKKNSMKEMIPRIIEKFGRDIKPLFSTIKHRYYTLYFPPSSPDIKHFFLIPLNPCFQPLNTGIEPLFFPIKHRYEILFFYH